MEVFGRLTVIGKDLAYSEHHTKLICQCSCGNILSVFRTNLVTGGTTSCGCFAKENSTLINTKHGKSHTDSYSSWDAMKQRCYNPKNVGYRDYGGRGITVCERWLESFENFYADIGDRPKGMTLDRIDNNGNYEPSNCKWSDKREQSINQRSGQRVRGVSWDGHANRWRASICPTKGQQKRLGSYHDWFEAVCARKSAENLYYRGG